MKIISKLWVFIGVLIVLSPLGLILPEYFKAGSTWGAGKIWNAPLPDYAFKGWEHKPIADLSLAYISSAIIGILICVCVVFILGKFLSKK